MAEDNQKEGGSKKEPVVLIVEDDPSLSKMYSEKFGHEGFKVVAVRDGESGLKYAIEKSPDFILLDMMLPKMEGHKVLELLNDNPKARSIPVIALTNLTEKEDAHKAIKMGVKEYLAKPLHTPEEVVERVKLHMGIL